MKKDHTNIAAVPHSAYKYWASAYGCGILWKSELCRGFLGSCTDSLCPWSLPSYGRAHISLILPISPWDTCLLQCQRCDPNYIFSDVLAVWSPKVMSVQWEGRNRHRKKASTRMYMRITLCTLYFQYALQFEHSNH